MKYKQISIKEAADRCRNGEAVYAARCIDGSSGSRNRAEAGKGEKAVPPPRRQ